MAQSSPVAIAPAQFPRDAQVVAHLFVAYAESLNIDLSFQNFQGELSQLPGKFASEKGGALLVASTTKISNSKAPFPQVSGVIGCIAVRVFKAPDTCELKRLYIKPEARGLGVGRVLMEAAMAKARELGYKEMLLDTLSSMTAARSLYAKYGFYEVDKYYDNPIEGCVFMKASL